MASPDQNNGLDTFPGFVRVQAVYEKNRVPNTVLWTMKLSFR